MNQKSGIHLGTSASDAIFAILVTIVNITLRLPMALQVQAPLNDGGLFYQMILDLQANHFLLPLFTTYNNAYIPFAYPPFGLYFAGLISSLFHIDVLTLARFLPSIINALSAPAFYFLARSILGPKRETAFSATLVFILTPRGFIWQIMGGGLTRAFGLLFALLTLRAAYELYTKHNNNLLIPLVCFGTLTVLSHPEAATHTVIAALIFYFLLDRSVQGALLSIQAASAILLLSAPWWATVIAHHGIDPFLAIISAAREGTSVTFGGRVFLTFQFNFTGEPFLPLIAVLGLIGLFTLLAQRKFLIPLWVTVPLFLEPRSAPQFMVIPLAILAGIGLTEILLPALATLTPDHPHWSKQISSIVVIYFFLYTILSAYIAESQVINITLKPEEFQAFQWIKNNTSQDSRFAILTNGGPVYDSIAEWFPALTKRTSVDTVFGTEWLRNESFRKNSMRYGDLQACLSRDESCIEAWAHQYNLSFSFILTVHSLKTK